MNIPSELKYTKEHEWVDIRDGIATIGITDFAQNELGDIVFIEFLNDKDSYLNGDIITTIEAVKTVADLYCPVDGSVIEFNVDLENSPESVNNDPYKSGWIAKIKVSTNSDLSHLLDSKAYKDLIK